MDNRNNKYNRNDKKQNNENNLKEISKDNKKDFDKAGSSTSAVKQSNQKILYKAYDKGYITPKLSENNFNKIKDNIFLALQKMSSSRKTKTVHKLVDQNNFGLSSVVGDFSDRLCFTIYKQNQLLKIMLNVSYYADFTTDHGVNTIISALNEVHDSIEKEKSIISEYQIQNIKKLKEKEDDLVNKLIKSFNTFKIVDGIYYGYLNFLTRKILETNAKESIKIFEVLSNIISKLLQSIYFKATHENINHEKKKAFDIISTYFILNYYYGDSPKIAITKIGSVYGGAAKEFLNRVKNNNIKDVKNIANILFETDLLKIKEHSFETLMKNILGELGYHYTKSTAQDAIVFFASLGTKNSLFNTTIFAQDEFQRIEELILNEKSKVLIKPQIII